MTYRFDDCWPVPDGRELVTLTCVSNPVGGDPISNAAWRATGCGTCWPRPVSTRTPTWCCRIRSTGSPRGTPVAAHRRPRRDLRGRHERRAAARRHGYPGRAGRPGLVRLRVGHQWVVDLELTRFDGPRPTGRGWAGQRAGRSRRSRASTCRAGPRRRAGSGHIRRGRVGAGPRCRGVEVRVDDGTWQEADLGASLFQRHLAAVEFSVAGHPAGPAHHRAGHRHTGAIQTADLADPVPDGATGWHTVSFAVK